MERPPLTDVLSSVLSAAVENTRRPALLATLQTINGGRSTAGNVIPLPRRSVESHDAHDHEPTPAA